jgi:hypothetical protein
MVCYLTPVLHAPDTGPAILIRLSDATFHDVQFQAADLGSRVFQDVGLRLLGSWDCEFESRRRKGDFLL